MSYREGSSTDNDDIDFSDLELGTAATSQGGKKSPGGVTDSMAGLSLQERITQQPSDSSEEANNEASCKAKSG